MLTPEQIDAVFAAGVKSNAISWLGFAEDADGRYTVPVVSEQHRQIARAIESEVRKQDEALIRQMIDAMQKPMKAWGGTCAWHGPLREAIAAANKRLGDKYDF
jgi:hypothetical protein